MTFKVETDDKMEVKRMIFAIELCIAISNINNLRYKEFKNVDEVKDRIAYIIDDIGVDIHELIK